MKKSSSNTSRKKPSTNRSKFKSLQDKKAVAKLKKIKLLILDIDGVMTDGRIFWVKNQGWTRTFHVKDGYGLKLLMKAGIQIAVISGGDSEDVRTRMEFLKIPYVFLGDEDKIIALEKIIKSSGFTTDQMAFMGDDLFDIPVIERVGFAATVPHATEPVKARVDYITEFEGGWGAVREVADAIRVSQGLGPYLK